MRLSCPNCDQTYDVPKGALPPAGQHVQCSACHTRWFARGQAPAAKLSEDEILANLDARRSGARNLSLVSGARREPLDAGDAAQDADEDAPFDWAAPDAEPDADEPTPAPDDPEADPAPDAKIDAADAPPAAPAAETTPAPAAPSAPETRGPDAGRPTRAAERRLDLTRAPEPGPAPAPKPQTSPPRFLDGFLLVLVLAAVAAALYAFADQIARGLPPLAGVINAYSTSVDAVREWFASLG